MRFPESIARPAFLLAAAAAFSAVFGCSAADAPSLKRLSKTDAVWLDEDRKELVVGGTVVLDRGPLELFACPKGTKEHEAVMAVDAKAQIVHAGLLALGLEPGRPVSFDPEYAPATGPVVKIRMRWKGKDGKVAETPAQDWIRDTRTGKPMAADWVFVGSSFWKDETTGEEFYQADGGDLVCISNFPTATLDLPIASSQSNEALLFEVMEGVVPPRDTAVEMILSKGIR
jgi:hypothetical protein